MNQELFELTVLKQKYENAPEREVRVKNKIVVEKDLTEAQNYIKQFFFPTRSGDTYIWERTYFTSIEDSKLSKHYLKKFPKPLKKWYEEDFDILYEVVNDFKKPRVYDNKINMAEQFKWLQQKRFNEYPNQIQDAVHLMLRHIKEVFCSNNEEVYRCLIYWIACVCQGKKNSSIIYARTPFEGIGKSLFTTFFGKYVIGNKLANLTGRAEAISSRFNIELLGKVLVVFEELKTFTDSEWIAVSGALKTMCTEDELMYEGKNTNSFKAENINNYWINTNVQALKDSHGRRIFILPISSHRLGDSKYFEHIANTCHNDIVGEAFFWYMVNEIDTRHFHAQKDMPVTQSKLDAIVSRLDSPYEFLKEEYLFNYKEVNCQAKTLLKQYEDWCFDNKKKSKGKFDFYRALADIGHKYYTSNKQTKFKITLPELKELAEKHKWIHETDDFDPNGKPKK